MRVVPEDQQQPASPQTAGFIALAKHDLSAKLRTIDTLVGFLLEDLGDNAPPTAVEHLEMIGVRAEEAESLLTSLVEYEQAGLPVILGTDRVRLTELISEVCTTIDRSPDISILMDVDPIVCSVDATALRGCLFHIINNAVQHRTVASGFIRISVSHSKSFVEILVEDDGAGIPPEYLEVACEPLRKLVYPGQLESGHGLGLAIVVRAAEAHGAQFRIESKQAIGTSVRLSWPTRASMTAKLGPNSVVQLS